MRVLLLVMLFICPLSTKAAVLISEVAWMGSAASANHEWIELHNTSDATIDVTDWVLGDGMNLLIPLQGTIPGNAYVVLERSSDASAQGAAFLIYTGSLVNTGASLSLKRADGALEDQVAGGESWESIGGDNLTKETAQYTTSGWVTGTPTPGAVNSGIPKDEDTSGEQTETGDSSNAPKKNPVVPIGRSEAVRLFLPDMTLKLVVGAQKLGYINQTIDFNVSPSGVGETLIDSLAYEWNFGDGTTAVSKEPRHTYLYPGTYVVTVYGGYKRQEQVARHELTILPVMVSLTTSPQGDVQVNNESPYEIDISGYRVYGGKDFVFPDRSVLLPNQTITVPSYKIGLAAEAVLYDNAGTVVTSREKSKPQDTPTVPTSQKKEVAVFVVPTEEEVKTWHAPLVAPEPLSTLTETLKEYVGVATAEASRESVATSSKKERIPKNTWPYLGLIAVIIVGLFGTAQKVFSNQT